MKTDYIEFELTINNREKCKVRYCDNWGIALYGNRTIHFEFRGSLAVSHTKYRSEFRVVGEHEKIDPQKAAEQIIEKLTGIKVRGKNIQQKLL